MHLRILLALFLLMTSAAQAAIYTPADTHQKIRTLAALTLLLQQQQHKPLLLPDVAVEGRKAPRHAYQKTLEVLSKINRYRVIHNLGPVAVPPYPARAITADEVHEQVQRLISEVRLLTGNPTAEEVNRILAQYLPETHTLIDDTINYKLLWRISKAFDPLLGVRGFTPSDVYEQTLIVLDAIRFLRNTQNIAGMPKKPPKPQGRHPNHALKEASHLIGVIRQAERNLWMTPVEVPKVPQRVITPTEVYDQMQTVIAELQRIKYRLGVERDLITPPEQKNKTPDDVIQNLRWARAAMPLFPLDKKLFQYDPASLIKTPSDVYAVADLIRRKLRAYKRFRGIRIKARKAPYVDGLKPRHVYQKATEALSKVVSLRQQVGLGASALPLYPMRVITPSDVYQMVSRLDRELDLLYRVQGMDTARFALRTFEDKRPSDVFQVVWNISYELDTILGSEGQTPSDVFRMALYLEQHARQLAQALGYSADCEPPPFKPGLKPAHVIVKARELFNLIEDMKKRAGIFTSPPPIPPHGAPVTPSDVYNLVGVIAPELIEIEVHLGIHEQIPYPPEISGKTPSHVYQQLEKVRRMLHSVRFGGHDK